MNLSVSGNMNIGYTTFQLDAMLRWTTQKYFSQSLI